MGAVGEGARDGLPVLVEAEDTEMDNDWVSVNGGACCWTGGQRSAIVTD